MTPAEKARENAAKYLLALESATPATEQRLIVAALSALANAALSIALDIALLRRQL